MEKKKQLILKFIAAGAGLGIIACVATALGMIQMTFWYLAECGDSASCKTAGWLIDYWWALFVPAILVSALVLRRLYEAGVARLGPEPE